MRLRGDPRGGGQGAARWTDVAELSPYALCAIVGAEDPAFFQHRGIWWSQVAARLYSAARSGGRAVAVSTITQQLARNLYLSEERSGTRKLFEVLLARRLEAVLEKRRILELYVNVVEWGPGTWGIEDAARAYFDASPRSLNPFQAVVLASLLPAPRAPLAGRNLDRALSSQVRLLHFLYGAGVMSLPDWRETSARMRLLAAAVRGGRAAGEVLKELGARPYERLPDDEGPLTSAELLESGCGLPLRIAYTAVLRGGDPRRRAMLRLPHRWTGGMIG
ncbi:MAG: transglycosylase domain-containing protein [Gemmatimonadetes bacterium]|nr:transglycosylase domain-containing protein [Gemmatimonadota bacterium]